MLHPQSGRKVSEISSLLSLDVVVLLLKKTYRKDYLEAFDLHFPNLFRSTKDGRRYVPVAAERIMDNVIDRETDTFFQD